VSADKLDDLAKRTAVALVDGISVSKVRAALVEAVAEERKRRERAEDKLVKVVDVLSTRHTYTPNCSHCRQLVSALDAARAAAREAKP
jgi:hypothetical protein